MIPTIILIILLYLLPGYFFSYLFSGKLRKSPFFILFLSFLTVPILYTSLVSFHILSFLSFFISEVMFAVLCLTGSKKLGELQKVNLDEVIPPFSLSPWVVLLGISFFLLVMSPRLGLWQGYFPIGDDQHQIRKIVSLAESPNEPLFYHFPTTRLTIYYFNNVAPGLLTKFSGNFVKANQAWFIHVGLQTALILWLLVRIGGSLLKNNTQRFIFLFGITYFSGLEFYLYKLKGIGYIDQLEWWSDWVFSQSKIHMQISNPFNLFFWVPQHLMAALFVLVVFVFLKSSEKNKAAALIFLALLWAGILGNSAFIFISTAVVYGVYMLIELKRTRDFPGLAKFNLPIIFMALILSVKNLELFLTAEKGHYFVPMSNVFWFVNNSTIFGKLVNFSITIPLYLFVEFGVLFFVLIYALTRFSKDEEFKNKYLFFYIFVFLLPVIFVVKSLDDNNISMRSFIPVQIALAIFAAELFESWISNKKHLFVPLLILAVASLPSGIFDFSLRFAEQTKPVDEKNYALYKQIDQKLPLNSIILAPFGFEDKITALGHRFTFKDPVLFNATDREHTARSKIARYEGFNISDSSRIYKLLEDNQKTLKDFRFYSLSSLSYGDYIVSGERLISEGGISVYPVEVKF